MTTKGKLKLNCPGTSLSYMFDGHLSRPDVTLWPEINGKLTGALVHEDQHMIDLVLGRTDMQVVTVEEAVRGIEFCRMLIESCDTGKVIDRSGL